MESGGERVLGYRADIIGRDIAYGSRRSSIMKPRARADLTARRHDLPPTRGCAKRGLVELSVTTSPAATRGNGSRVEVCRAGRSASARIAGDLDLGASLPRPTRDHQQDLNGTVRPEPRAERLSALSAEMVGTINGSIPTARQ